MIRIEDITHARLRRKKMGWFVSRKTHELELYKQSVRNNISELQDTIWELEEKISKLEDKIETIKEK